MDVLASAAVAMAEQSEYARSVRDCPPPKMPLSSARAKRLSSLILPKLASLRLPPKGELSRAHTAKSSRCWFRVSSSSSSAMPLRALSDEQLEAIIAELEERIARRASGGDAKLIEGTVEATTIETTLPVLEPPKRKPKRL